jgi:hypothetical protein
MKKPFLVLLLIFTLLFTSISYAEKIETKYMDFMYGQIKELCENYQPRLFWFDGSSGFRNVNKKRLLGQQEMVDLLNSYGAICNSR